MNLFLVFCFPNITKSSQSKAWGLAQFNMCGAYLSAILIVVDKIIIVHLRSKTEKLQLLKQNIKPHFIQIFHLQIQEK
jgi:hypothetical protein